LKIYFNIILPSTPRYSKCFFPHVPPPPKPCMYVSFSPFGLHVLHISFFLIFYFRGCIFPFVRRFTLTVFAPRPPPRCKTTPIPN
jgi:hypothetical protein